MNLPKINHEERKSEIYAVRLSPTQKDLIGATAKQNNVNQSTVIRTAINQFLNINER